MAVVLLTSPVLIGISTAQSVTETDDFEDGNVDGWESPEGETPSVSEDSYEGDYSLLAETDDLSSQDQAAFLWKEGPTLDTTESFDVTYTVKVDNPDDLYTIRTGVTGDDQEAEGENAFVIFDTENDETYLSTNDTKPEGAETINTDYEDEWIRVDLSSDGEELSAEIEPLEGSGSTENLSQEGFDGIVGEFGVNPGFASESQRSIWLDSVTVEGTQAGDEEIDIETRNYLQHDQTAGYTVYYTDPTGEKEDVTGSDDLSVESDNESLFTIDESNTEIESTEDTSVNDRAKFTAEYQGYENTKSITVANATVENLDILPVMWKINATITDDTIIFILISTLAGILGTRFATSFAGLGLFDVSMIMGWFIGYANTGIVLLTVFASLFIGLNMAANIDYTVRR